MEKKSMNRNKSKLKVPTFPRAAEGDWYRVERALGEYLRSRAAAKEGSEEAQKYLVEEPPRNERAT
jgi:hypothetical protein